MHGDSSYSSVTTILNDLNWPMLKLTDINSYHLCVKSSIIKNQLKT